MQPPEASVVERVIREALSEDIGAGDITSQLLIPEATQARMALSAREALCVAGIGIAARVFATVDRAIICTPLVEDGQRVKAGTVLARVEGPARGILAAERTALNLLQRMCGVANLTACYVDAVKGTGATILDTRKTMPGLRVLDKYAVRCGGGGNHRMRLDDAILIKDNHIALAGSVADALRRVQASTLPVIVECDTLSQVREALQAGARRLLLDNMDNATLAQAVALARGQAECEASGNVTLETVRAIAETGVDYISIGRLTHSAPAADIGLDSD